MRRPLHSAPTRRYGQLALPEKVRDALSPVQRIEQFAPLPQLTLQLPLHVM